MFKNNFYDVIFAVHVGRSLLVFFQFIESRKEPPQKWPSESNISVGKWCLEEHVLFFGGGGGGKGISSFAICLRGV